MDGRYSSSYRGSSPRFRRRKRILELLDQYEIPYRRVCLFSNEGQ